MNLSYIDIHSHNNLSPLFEKHQEVFSRMRDEGVGTITVGTDLETSKRAVSIAESNPDICWATVGFHPCDIPTPTLPEGEGAAQQDRVRTDWDELEALARHPKVVALGETGLDYFHNDTPELRHIQTEIFKKHIALAIKVQKPLMLHVRSSKGSDDAYYDALEILKPLRSTTTSPYKGEDPAPVRANFHFFSGSKKCMEDIIAAGYTISVDGPITFSQDYDEMIRAVPLDRIMIETDAPFAAPKPYRGKVCEPWMVVHVAEKIAEIKGLPFEGVRDQLLKNSQDFFNLQ